MAIKKDSSRTINDFRRYYKRTVALLIVASQLVTMIGFCGVLVLTSFVSWQHPLFWIGLVASFGFSIAVLAILIPSVTSPLYDILAALSHKTGEPSTHTPPNPNSKNNQRTGLKSVLQTIYNTESTATVTPNEQKELDIHATLTDALNHTSCGVVLLDAHKQIISASRAAPIGHSQEGAPFLALDFLNQEDILSWLAKCEEKSLNAERRWMRVGTDQNITKRKRFFDIIASYEKGATAETVIILIDQTKNYSPEEEDLNFIAFAAHELRGPITVIRGYLDILEDELSDRLKGDEAELISRLQVSANRLSGYVNNILNVARFDQHHLQVHLHEDTIRKMYDTIADDMQMRAKAQHRILSVTLPDDLPSVAADRSSISEVIANLIDNAIKYSFEGGVVELSAVVKGDFVEVSVTDNGVGMPASVVKNLFRKFYRSHRSREAVAGTGIGLYICKAFIESHGGTMSVSSRENEGSTFAFTLPIYATVADKLLEDKQLNQSLIRHGSGWIKNHAMYRR